MIASCHLDRSKQLGMRLGLKVAASLLHCSIAKREQQVAGQRSLTWPFAVQPTDRFKASGCTPGSGCRCSQYCFDDLASCMPASEGQLHVHVQVLDAADLTKGPIARILLRHHVPHGLHGYYSDAYFGPSSTGSEEAPPEEAAPPLAGSPGPQLHNNAQVPAWCLQSAHGLMVVGISSWHYNGGAGGHDGASRAEHALAGVRSYLTGPVY